MEDCIFCKIIRGEIPSLKFYEDSSVIAVLDINPANYGHALIIPKQHFATIDEAPEGALCDAMKVAKMIASKLKQNFGAQGVNIIQNNGKAAGQIVHHFHIHVIPRYEGDKVYITYERMQPDPEKMKEALEKFASSSPSAENEKPTEDVPPEDKFTI